MMEKPEAIREFEKKVKMKFNKKSTKKFDFYFYTLGDLYLHKRSSARRFTALVHRMVRLVKKLRKQGYKAGLITPEKAIELGLVSVGVGVVVKKK